MKQKEEKMDSEVQVNKEFKKAIDDFVEHNFGEDKKGNEPRMLYGSMSAIKSLLPYKDWEWTRIVEAGTVYFEVKAREGDAVFYVTEHTMLRED